MNNCRQFDQLQVSRLGKYIYALRDPRDRKIFYVGQGTGNRVFDHFNEADALYKEAVNLQIVSSKTLRILDIWKHDFDGQGHFRIKRGSQDRTTWHACD